MNLQCLDFRWIVSSLVTFGGSEHCFLSFPPNYEWSTSNVFRKSGYGQGDGLGDNGDDWKVICSAKYWRRESKVYFQHVDSGKFLGASSTVKFTHQVRSENPTFCHCFALYLEAQSHA
mmetsp:Transcript_21906/g.51660  ORF Transcript_21906/g.51660 Transcript_21906/m.51660 type:complete len:118 (+) Transcript_21906:498-851(+)